MPADTSTIPITRLEAVNQMLTAVGSSSVMTLATSNANEEAQDALTALSDTWVEVHRWHFNTEEDYPLEPNTDGHIVLPLTEAYERAPDGHAGSRGTKLAMLAGTIAKYRAAALKRVKADPEVREALFKKTIRGALRLRGIQARVHGPRKRAQSTTQ